MACVFQNCDPSNPLNAQRVCTSTFGAGGRTLACLLEGGWDRIEFDRRARIIDCRIVFLVSFLYAILDRLVGEKAGIEGGGGGGDLSNRAYIEEQSKRKRKRGQMHIIYRAAYTVIKRGAKSG